jgi:hypothetical protein
MKLYLVDNTTVPVTNFKNYLWHPRTGNITNVITGRKAYSKRCILSNLLTPASIKKRDNKK